MIPIPQLSKGDFPGWDDIAGVFAASPALFMKQAWLEKNDERFRPGEVRIGWHGDRILVYARLEDEEIHSGSTADNQKLWTLGDAFEIFLRDPLREDYCEFHVNPNSHRLQVRFPSAEHFRACEGDIAPYIVTEPLFDFQMRVMTGSWEVFASIPASSINPDAESPHHRTVLASFSRYDWSSKNPPVLSSTSPHSVLSFHRQEEWSVLQFQ